MPLKPICSGRLALLIGLILLTDLICGCAARKDPAWVNSESPMYPSSRYLTGVGIAKERKAAENEAIAGIARIFQARVNSLSQDIMKSHSRMNQKGNEIETEENFVQKTAISTQVILEGVVISDVFVKGGEIYALATLEKAALRQRLSESISTLDQEIKLLNQAYKAASSKIEKIRQLHWLAQKAVARESLNAQLKIVSPIGTGMEGNPELSLGKLLNEFENLRFANFKIVVQVEGTSVSEFKNSVEESLTQLHFVVAKEALLSDADLLVRGHVDVSALDHPDKSWKWMQYSADFYLIEPASQKTVRTLPNIRGQVAQLTIDAARLKAILTLKDKIKKGIAEELNTYIYGAVPANQSANGILN